MSFPLNAYPYSKSFVLSVSALTILIGLFGLISRSFNIPWLSMQLQPFISMCFILNGCALYLLFLQKKDKGSFWVTKVCIGIVLGVGLKILFEYLFDWKATTTEVQLSMYPLGVSLAEAINFILLSVVLLLLDLNKKYGETILVLCFLIFSFTMLSVFGYIFRVHDNVAHYYVNIPFIPGLLFILLSIACIFTQSTQDGIINVFVEDTSSGKYVRRILFAVIFIPIIVAYLENLGEMYHLYDPDFGDSILSMLTLMLIMLLIGINAKYMFEEEKKKIEATKTLDYVTDFDDVTGLLNYQAFELKLEEILKEPTHKLVAVVKVDLNQFELISNVSGYLVGDMVLKHLTERYKSSVQLSNAVIARVGAKEFGFIFTDIKDVFQIANLVNKILELTSEIITVNGKNIFMTASAGISIYPDNGHDADSLLLCVDQALHLAKRQVGNFFQFFTSHLSLALSDRLEIENALHLALSENQFELYYQPQLDLKTGKVCGAEALLRWVHPEKGIISPAIFVPVAESTGLIVAIGEWILREVCQQIKNGWPFLAADKKQYEIPIAINVSPTQFAKGYAIEAVFERIVKEFNIDPKLIELEITESALMQDMQVNLQRFADFKKIGFNISLDDFGTGFSSFSYINRIPNDKVKIDKSFIDGVPGNKNDEVLMKAIIDMFHQLDKIIVAEGVETGKQKTFLKKINCDIVQGYNFSKPLSLKEFKKFVNTF